MTLSIMDNHEAIKTALKEYQNNTGDIPKVLERYLEYVARTGRPLFSWDLMSVLILKKFENVIDDFMTEKPIQNNKSISIDNLSTQSLKQECFKALNSLTGVPFTIQRVCELLLSPKKNYSRLDKFLRGFLRVIKVVTTVDRIGQKITTESQLFANAMSPFEISESGDGWASFSGAQCDENSVHLQLHSSVNESNNQSLLDSSDVNNGGMDYLDENQHQQPAHLSLTTTCLHPADSAPTAAYASKIVEDDHDQTPSINSDNIYHLHHPHFSPSPQTQTPPQTPDANQQYFIDQQHTPKSSCISMPPIGALFKPIDQLEAFVQNVVSNNTSTSTPESTDQQQPSTPTSCKKRPSNDTNSADINHDRTPIDSINSSSIDNDNSEDTGSGDIDSSPDDYSSPAKKRRIDNADSELSHLLTQHGDEGVISSSDTATPIEMDSIIDTSGDANDPHHSHDNHHHSNFHGHGNNGTGVVSSEAAVCNEEPSSSDEAPDRSGSVTDLGGSNDGNGAENSGMEADQSNQLLELETSGIVPVAGNNDAEREESMTVSLSASSSCDTNDSNDNGKEDSSSGIDEETGEHV